jgi:hypothetical protein
MLADGRLAPEPAVVSFLRRLIFKISKIKASSEPVSCGPSRQPKMSGSHSEGLDQRREHGSYSQAHSL